MINATKTQEYKMPVPVEIEEWSELKWWYKLKQNPLHKYIANLAQAHNMMRGGEN